MGKTRFCLAVAVGLFLASGSLRADVWDLDTSNEDDSSATDNEALHGTVQVHDLMTQGGTFDQDWYTVAVQPYSSYEAVIQGLTGDLFNAVGVSGIAIDRVNGAGGVLSAGQPLTGNFNQSVRWQNVSGSPTVEYLRVQGVGSCGLSCDTNDQYTFRFYETTASIARYNNSGTQVTVLMLQNPASYTINGRIFYWSATGVLVANQPFAVGPKQLITVATASVTGATSGSITITQDGRYGDLQGKTIALEPSTGFSFDTPMVYRPH
jgi:hypothetical protein